MVPIRRRRTMSHKPIVWSEDAVNRIGPLGPLMPSVVDDDEDGEDEDDDEDEDEG